MSFKSWLSYSDFSENACSKLRYILDNESSEFLNSINDTCSDRVKTLKVGSVVWRAQTGCGEEKASDNVEQEFHVDKRIPFPFERMKPLTNSASEGRANSKGIPCLYVAADAETAIHEVRPWPGLTLTIAQLHLTKDVKLIDFSETADAEQYPYFFFGEPSINQRIDAVWAAMDIAFSWPVTGSDSKSEYVPTQIISEFIKSKGYDGIIYKSSLTKGRNYVLFNLNDAAVVQCDLFVVSKAKFDFEKLDGSSSLTAERGNT
ncbi:RES family NAD+ phosphorylase [Pseudoalteromonas sp. 1_2015MBL_MicDiv]|uniref:RES family NAD+ phosphorylase n=1 Tax=Pseudoalteromonas sp. 1_2015MBL_MicDiv TaxID=1720343 RepID=UPI000BBE522D|nr:RES family NAD+ phosphorylase [Pseudoalteromonas sp. 1_2015MBL_MicDiv]